MKVLSEENQREQEIKAQNEYLRKQLGVFLKKKQQANEEPLQSDSKTKNKCLVILWIHLVRMNP